MKTFIIFTLLIALASAQFDHHHDDDRQRRDEMIKALLDRGHLLLRITQDVLEKHRLEGDAHLLQAIEHEAIEVEALMKDLESFHPDDLISLHHFHMIEEDLLFHEHRISEEIAILEEHKRDHHDDDHHGDLNHLIQRAKELLHRAQEALEKHRNADRRELRAMRYEMETVEHLVEQLEHPEGHDVRRLGEELARHERSLDQLILRINDEHNHHRDDPHH